MIEWNGEAERVPTLGKTIELYLKDGTEGRWKATLSNWNGVGYKIPRGMLKKCDDLPELNTPGVYFLFGKDDDTGRQFIYVGEAEDVRKRLSQSHTFDKDSYWTEAVIFLASDGSLDKGRVKYLEHRFYTIAIDAKRYLVKKGNTPTKSALPSSAQDSLEGFSINVKLVLLALGHKAFIPLPSSDMGKVKSGEDDLLYLTRSKPKPWRAIGKVTAEGFWVLQGSYIHPKLASYVPANVRKAREQYAGSIGADDVLQEDLCFGSPSFASTFVCGKNTSGPNEWKNAQGIPLSALDMIDVPKAAGKKKKAKPKTKTAPPTNDASDTAEAEILHLRGNKVKATGTMDENGFTVLAGSQYISEETKGCPAYVRKMRMKLVNEGTLSNGAFLKDVHFQSPSGAACCILGRSANGKLEWLYPDGASIQGRMQAKEGALDGKS